MIRVTRPGKPPEVLRRRGAAEGDALCAEFDAAPEDCRSGKRILSFKSAIYAHSTVKTSLRDGQNGKCAFCESKVGAVAYGDVEHFRPKAGYQQQPGDGLGKPGYYWLAYEWTNLLYVCQLCNQQRKKNLFPLANPHARATSHHDDVKREVPLLINPAACDPETLIGFHEEVAYPRNDGLSARKTIEILGLNRPALSEKRRDCLKLLRLLENLRKLVAKGIAASGDSTPSEWASQLQELDAELVARQRNRAEFAAMARAALS